MSLLTINGADIADPIELQWDISDIEGDSTGRSQEGNLFRDRVTVKQKSRRWVFGMS